MMPNRPSQPPRRMKDKDRWRSTCPTGTVTPFIMAGTITATTGGVCSDDNVTACTMANESIDCGGSNTCLTAPQAGPWHPVVGAFEISFYAMGSGTSAGTPQVSVSAWPDTGGTNVSHTFTLTNDGNWHQYVYPFTGTDTAASCAERYGLHLDRQQSSGGDRCDHLRRRHLPRQDDDLGDGFPQRSHDHAASDQPRLVALRELSATRHQRQRL